MWRVVIRGNWFRFANAKAGDFIGREGVEVAAWMQPFVRSFGGWVAVWAGGSPRAAEQACPPTRIDLPMQQNGA